MTRARDVSRLVTTPPDIYATDTETSSAGYLTNSSASSTYLTQTNVSFAGKNKIINGAMQIWQRGTSFVPTNSGAGAGYTADRWQSYRNAIGSTISRQTTSDTTNIPFIQYSLRVQRDSGNTSTANIAVGQSIESSNTFPIINKTVVLSFYARVGANFSAASSVIRTRLLSSANTDQNFLINGGTTVIDQNVTLTTSWQRFSYSGTVGSAAVSAGVIFDFTPVGTASTNDWFEVTGVQLEEGPTVTNFIPAGGGSQQTELTLCQRYFWRGFVAAGGAWGGSGGTVPLVGWPYPVKMRTAPAWAWISGGVAGNGNIGYNVTGIVTSTIQADSAILGFSISGSTGSNAQGCYVYDSLNSFSAEL
jgi:hypothetical protein